MVGRIDEIHILSAVRAAPIVGYLSPSHICDACALLRARKLDMEMPPDTSSVGLAVNDGVDNEESEIESDDSWFLTKVESFNSTFHDNDQKSSYTDYMQLSIQSQFNKRELQ